MVNSFYLPTRLVYGNGALAQLPSLLEGFGLKRPIVVSDPIISKTKSYSVCVDGLQAANLEFLAFNECGIDARVVQIDAQAERVRNAKVDCVIAIGGGSVLCTGKGIAIVAPNFKSVREAEGMLPRGCKPLPMFMIPTTAGSGSEVSQFTIIKDDEQHRKFVTGGPAGFPVAAVLDPVVLETLPRGPASVSAVDALTHGIEAVFSNLSTPLTDAIALESIRLLVGSVRKSILDNDRDAQAINLLAASMSNMACGNTRLCLAHSLGEPLGGKCNIPHGMAVGVLMPHVLSFNASHAPDRVSKVAEAFGLPERRRSIEDLRSAMRKLYDDIGFRRFFTSDQLNPNVIDELARDTAIGLYGGGVPAEDATDDTVIPSPNIRRATVRDVAAIYHSCLNDW
jgi:alcohol dehydrogenase class IV